MKRAISFLGLYFFSEYGQKNLGRGTLGVGSSDLLK